MNIKRWTCAALTAAIMMMGSAQAQVANRFWSANGSTLGGAGTWNTSSSTNWGSAAAGPFSTNWVNANNDTAVFNGAGATVTLAENITVGGITFNKVNGGTTYYTLNTAANTLSFASGANTLLFNIGNGGVSSATITGKVDGVGANLIIAPQGTVASGGSTPGGTLTFNGTSTGGWSGATTINWTMTLATVSTAALTNKVLSSTTGGITINGGTIQFTRASNANIDAINNSAIRVNGGGTFSVTSSGGGASAIENIGTVTVNSGQMNFVQTANNQNSLVLTGLSVANNAAITVGVSGSAFTTAAVMVSGASATLANEIIGPWATVGTGAAAQTDYAVYDGSSRFVARNIAASAESAWSTTHAIDSNYTLANASGSSANGRFTVTRNINSLRNTTASTAVTADNTTDYITLNAHGFVAGDVVVLGGTTVPTGLAFGQPYYVINTTANTFQLSTTSGGAAALFSANGNAVNIAGGITLPSGLNLGTYGILNGSAAALAIGGNGGAVTLPTTTSSNLYVMAGSGNIGINAPITDNGAGVLTLVKSGSSILTLSGNNTFTGGIVLNAGTLRLSGTQSFTGGITLSGGAFGDSTDFISAAELGSNSVTVNGNASMYLTSGETLANAIAISSTGNIKLNGPTVTLGGVVSGSGVLTITSSSSPTVTLANTVNTHTGVISMVNDNNQNINLAVNSLADSASPGAGNIQMGGGAVVGGYTFFLHSGATAPLILNNRQVELAGDGYSAGMLCKLANNSSQAFTINSNLRCSGSNVKTLTLGGSGTGLSTFAGAIANGGLTTLNLTKADANTWALGGTNTYNGVTTVSAGTLVFQGKQALPAASAISIAGASTTKFLDDGSGVISFGNNISHAAQNFTTTLFVGNNNTANGGNSSGTTTGSTIALGNYSFYDHTDLYTRLLSVTGANGYRLRLADVLLFTQGGSTLGSVTNREAGVISATSAPVTITGTVIQRSGKLAYDAARRAYFDFFTLDGTATGCEVSGTIKDALDFTDVSNANATPLGVYKRGTGTWTLSGANTYVGVTTIASGLLRINGSLSTGAVNVVAGSLGGTGTVNGAVTVTNTGSIDLRDGAVGTLTVNTNLAINGAAGANILYFELGDGASGSDKIVVTGNVSMPTSGAGVIVLSQLGGSKLNAGTTNDLIEVTGTIPAASSFTLATTAFAGSTLSLQVTGKKLQVVVVADATAGPAATSWTGGVNTNWSNGNNWTGGTAPGYLSDVTFYNAGVNLNTAMDTGFDINSLIFSTGATSAGTISGSRMLTIEATSGVGILVNTPSSGTPVHRINSMVGLGTNQTWTVNANGSLTVAGAVSDFGLGRSLTKAGTGTLTLGGTNTYTGGTVINAGKVIISADSNLGAANSALTFNGTSTLQLDATVDLGLRPIFLADGAIATFEKPSTSAFNLTTAGAVTGAGGVTLYPWNNNGSTLTFSSSGNTFTGPILITNNNNVQSTLVLNSLGDSTNTITLSNGNDNIVTFSYTGAPLTLANRRFVIAGVAGKRHAIDSTVNPLIINNDIEFSGSGARSLLLGGAGGGTFVGRLTDNVGGALSLTLNSAWNIRATNTYTGATTVNSYTVAAVFQGASQALPTGSTLTIGPGAVNQNPALKLLDDGAGTINLGNALAVNMAASGSRTSTFFLTIGNNNTANGGYSSGTTTGSTIVLGALSFNGDSRINPVLQIDGTDGYKLQVGSVTNYPGGSGRGAYTMISPTTSSITITGTVTEGTNRLATANSFSDGIELSGKMSGNLISGNIMDAADYTNGSNPNARPLSLLKSGTSEWTLSGINTHSGSNTVSGGTLVINGGLKSQCLSDINLLAISGGKVRLPAGVREKVGSLKLGAGAVVTGPTTYGSSTSSAVNKDDTYFAIDGTGVLYVGMDIPADGTLIMFM